LDLSTTYRQGYHLGPYKDINDVLGVIEMKVNSKKCYEQNITNYRRKGQSTKYICT
jgi:hypothetical protein